MVQQIMATEPPYIGYFCSQSYAKPSAPKSNAPRPQPPASAIKDTSVLNNSNVRTLAADWAESEEDKANPVVTSGRRFKSGTAADKYIDTLNHGPKRLQGQTSLIKFYEKKCRGIISPGVKYAINYRKDQSWKAAHWTLDQFEELIQLLLSLSATLKTNFQDQSGNAFQTISSNWGMEVAKVITKEKGGPTCH